SPARAAPFGLTGVTLTAFAGAIGVIVGLPVVPGPSAEVTTIPSLVIALILFFRAAAMLTWNVRSTLAPAARLMPLQVTLPPPDVPPWPADENVVLAGIGSLTVTPVAAALPMLRSVIV